MGARQSKGHMEERAVKCARVSQKRCRPRVREGARASEHGWPDHLLKETKLFHLSRSRT